MVTRKLQEKINNRLSNEPRKFIQVVSGPRQVGKTTMVQQIKSSIKMPVHYISADSVTNEHNKWISQQWEIARINAEQSSDKESLLIIDEIQKIQNWSEQVKAEWDYDTQEGNLIKVVLLGSSSLLIQQGLSESLAGRFEKHYLGHWSYTEMKEGFDFSLNQYIFYGGYPGAADLIHDHNRWKSYIKNSLIETSISKDILMLTRVLKPALLKQLFDIGLKKSSEILSYNKIIGQLQDAGNTTTIAHYLELLDAAGLLGGIEKYASARHRKRASSPKFQVHNNALLSAECDQTLDQLMLRPQQWGQWVESAVGSHLINLMKQQQIELNYWRHRNDEVDFVIKRGDLTIGLEVKSNLASKTQGLAQFDKEFSPKKTLIIGRGGLSLEKFLSMDIEALF